MWSSPLGKSSNVAQRDPVPADKSRRESGSSALPSQNPDTILEGKETGDPEQLQVQDPKPTDAELRDPFSTPSPKSKISLSEQRDYGFPTDKNKEPPASGSDSQAGGGVFGKLKSLTSGIANLGRGTTQTGQDVVRDPLDLSILRDLPVKEGGDIVGPGGEILGRVVEGGAGAVGGVVGEGGSIFDEGGNTIGRAELVQDAQDVVEQAKSAPGSIAVSTAKVLSQDGTQGSELGNALSDVQENLPEGAPGSIAASTADAPNQDGTQVFEPGKSLSEVQVNMPDEVSEEIEEELPPLSTLEGLTANKMGKIISPLTGKPIGELTEGDPKKLSRLGSKLDAKGQFWDSRGNVIGKAQTIRFEDYENEPPFAGLEGLHVVEDGFVEDSGGRKVGKIAEGDTTKLIGRPVDEDGDVTDTFGSVKGHAEPYEAPEDEKPVEQDLSILEGKIVNKAGNIVDEHGTVYGRITSGDKRLAGRKVDAKGQIWGDNGTVVGRAELIPGAEQEKPEGPFYGFQPAVVGKDGLVFDSSSRIIGRIIEGDPKRLLGRGVDEDGDILDKDGNVIGRVERWEPEEKERNVNPMSGRKVTREGEIRDVDGNLIGKLTSGNLATLVGKEIDDNGYVVDNGGNKVGECTLLQNLPDEKVEEVVEVPGPSPEEIEAQKKAEEDKNLAKKMIAIVVQTLDHVQPICKMITENIDKADRTPREELDEEELVKNVKPLLEEAGRLLQECNGAIRALDPDGHIAATAKARAATHEASPEEYTLADKLKELTDTVVNTIESSRRKIADMPHAKKELNPLWGLLSEPLFQIIAAVGLLLTGVLGLVGRLLEGLGLGPLVHGLLGGLGLDKLLGGLGLTALTDSLGLTGKKK